MSDPVKRRRLLVGAGLGAAAVAAVVGLGFLADAGSAASAAKPRVIARPVVGGAAQEGRTLAGGRGRWANNPTDYNYFWVRCDRNGNRCANISGAHAARYTLTSADVGARIRFRVEARNADGSSFAASLPTAVIAPAAQPPPPPPPATGCPSGAGPVPIASVTPPARLLVDQMQFAPSVVVRETTRVIARFHVSNTCGQAVQGALVYATAVPFNQLSIPAEQATDQAGWAALEFRALAGFPASPNQQLIAIFVRARKQGENLLAGISTRRLVSLRADVR